MTSVPKSLAVVAIVATIVVGGYAFARAPVPPGSGAGATGARDTPRHLPSVPASRRLREVLPHTT